MRRYIIPVLFIVFTIALISLPQSLNIAHAQSNVCGAGQYFDDLVGGCVSDNSNTGGSNHGVFTSRPGTLTNDYFVNLLDMSTKWTKSGKDEGLYEGVDRATGAAKWTATPVDLAFGSNSELRAIAEVYGCEDSAAKFVHDFVAAWNKVMMLDRFDV